MYVCECFSITTNDAFNGFICDTFSFILISLQNYRIEIRQPLYLSLLTNNLDCVCKVVLSILKLIMQWFLIKIHNLSMPPLQIVTILIKRTSLILLKSFFYNTFKFWLCLLLRTNLKVYISPRYIDSRSFQARNVHIFVNFSRCKSISCI